MTEPSFDERATRTRFVVAWLLVGMVITGAWDLATDSPRIWRSAHAVIEVAFVLLAAISAILLMRGWRETERSLSGVSAALSTQKAERDHWKRLAETALRGLGEAIDQQFDAWSLTPAERETALLLLKGSRTRKRAG